MCCDMRLCCVYVCLPVPAACVSISARSVRDYPVPATCVSISARSVREYPAPAAWLSTNGRSVYLYVPIPRDYHVTTT